MVSRGVLLERTKVKGHPTSSFERRDPGNLVARPCRLVHALVSRICGH